MGSAFGWLSDLLSSLGKFIPRLLIIKRTHGGVAFSGKRATPLSSGYYVYIPLITEVLTYPVVRQTVNLVTQCLITQDFKSIVVGGIVVYRVHDILEALASNWDLEESIRDISLAVIKKVIVSKSFEEICHQHEEIDAELAKELGSKLQEFGVTVINAYLSDISPCIVIRNIGQEGTLIPSSLMGSKYLYDDNAQ